MSARYVVGELKRPCVEKGRICRTAGPMQTGMKFVSRKSLRFQNGREISNSSSVHVKRL